MFLRKKTILFWFVGVASDTPHAHTHKYIKLKNGTLIRHGQKKYKNKQTETDIAYQDATSAFLAEQNPQEPAQAQRAATIGDDGDDDEWWW